LGLFDQFKELKMILAHLGQYFETDEELLRALSKKPNVYLDTSGVRSEAILSALRVFDLDRILFGTDWPFCTHQEGLHILVKAVERYSHSSTERRVVAEKILSTNPRKCGA
jgi:predicted TIM-barrel fold metal-dependent hydrolase